jgi:Sec-independent protein translocase protein TatA
MEWQMTNMSIWHWIIFLAAAVLMFHFGSKLGRD